MDLAVRSHFIPPEDASKGDSNEPTHKEALARKLGNESLAMRVGLHQSQV